MLICNFFSYSLYCNFSRYRMICQANSPRLNKFFIQIRQSLLHFNPLHTTIGIIQKGAPLL
ncbi:hypothetical protein HMPREF0239_01127 [Clostridium sp. ATCC BAA-442]|nr:hypothetical protein HMPREF0239_01127 [Clostridium sp. ATCC BAA-442]